MGTRMAVSTNNGGSWQSKPQLRADDMYNSLVLGVQAKVGDLVISGVLRELLDLGARGGIGEVGGCLDMARAGRGWDVVV